MPAGDGVSLPTTLAQMGSVAKTQAKGQHTQVQATPFSEQMNKDDELRVQRIKQTEETHQDEIDANQENPDKRQRRRLNRQRKRLREGAELDYDPDDAENEDDAAGEAERLGVLIDMRV